MRTSIVSGTFVLVQAEKATDNDNWCLLLRGDGLLPSDPPDEPP